MAADRFSVVRNAEEQYSVWFADREVPHGWDAVGFEGTRAECLAEIAVRWEDPRPLSLRRALADA
jgi:MbtH protein